MHATAICKKDTWIYFHVAQILWADSLSNIRLFKYIEHKGFLNFILSPLNKCSSQSELTSSILNVNAFAQSRLCTQDAVLGHRLHMDRVSVGFNIITTWRPHVRPVNINPFGINMTLWSCDQADKCVEIGLRGGGLLGTDCTAAASERTRRPSWRLRSAPRQWVTLRLWSRSPAVFWTDFCWRTVQAGPRGPGTRNQEPGTGPPETISVQNNMKPRNMK